MMELSPATEAVLADRQAERYEAMAASREERSARWYGGGSYAFVDSIATAEEHRKTAVRLRAQSPGSEWSRAEGEAQATSHRSDNNKLEDDQ